MMDFAGVFIFMPGHADGDDVGVGGVMQHGIGIMHSAVHSIAVDVFENRLVFGIAVFNIAVFIQLSQLVFITFVFNQYRIILPVFCAAQQ